MMYMQTCTLCTCLLLATSLYGISEKKQFLLYLVTRELPIGLTLKENVQSVQTNLVYSIIYNDTRIISSSAIAFHSSNASPI